MKTIKAYKLLTPDMTSHGDCKWEIGEWKKVSGEGKLCGPGWLHFYTHPLLAALLNAIHANMRNPVLWEAEVRGKSKDNYGLKQGWTEGRVMRELLMPKLTVTQRVRFGILAVKEVYSDPQWSAWADNWLTGRDRSAARAEAAVVAAWAAEGAAAAAREAAWAAAREATGAAAEAAWTAAEAAEAAAMAARWAAARAAEWAAECKPLDLIAIAKRAVGEI